MQIGKDSRALKGVKKILAQRINSQGFLQKFFDNKEQTPRPKIETTSHEIPLNERFAFACEVTQIPKAGDTVIAVRNNQQRQIRLLEELDAGVCFPLAMLYNQRNEFVGYLMRSAQGRDLGKSVFMPMLLKKYFPNWNRVDTVQLCVRILQKLKYLHDRNVILGDINPFNIPVVSPTEVYFFDTDSYQVEGFACPVGMPLFTAPELHRKKDYGLRTMGNENFAVATLLFMIMHHGKPP